MKPVFRRPVAGLAIVGAVALIAGCGGSDDSDALSAEEFRTQADAICADVDRTTDAIAEPTSEEGILPFLQETREATSDGLDRLRDLNPPEELSDTWDEAISLNEEQADTLDEAISRIEGGENPLEVIEELTPALDERRTDLRQKASELGLTVCGSDEDEAPDTPPATGTLGQYVDDVQEAAGSLQEFGELLQNIDSVEQLEAQAGEAQGLLDDFDAGIARLDGYTLDDPEAERQRANLVAVGPNVSDVLRRFVDAAASGDEQAVQSLLPEVLSVLQDFTNAATDTQ